MPESVILHFGGFKVWSGAEYFYPNRPQVTLAVLSSNLKMNILNKNNCWSFPKLKNCCRKWLVSVVEPF